MGKACLNADIAAAKPKVAHGQWRIYSQWDVLCLIWLERDVSRGRDGDIIRAADHGTIGILIAAPAGEERKDASCIANVG